MLRGINKQQIFKDNDDYEKFIQILKDCKAISEFKLFAYCLMGNHVHLLIKPVKEPIEQVFKRIGSRFVYWYNIKYQRSGHLFQDRFKSEPVEDDSYFLTVLRYIHQNPVKAGICKKPCEYEYNSYNEYIKDKELIDCEFVFDMISVDEFVKFNNTYDNEKCLDITDEKMTLRLTDEQAQAVIYKYSKCHNVSEFQELNAKKHEKYVIKFRNNGLSIRQISRLTGISKGMVEKMDKQYIKTQNRPLSTPKKYNQEFRKGDIIKPPLSGWFNYT